MILKGEHVGISITEVLFRAPTYRRQDDVKKV